MAALSELLRGAGAGLMEAAWEARRRTYALGWRSPARVGARVVSVGNLTVGGAGKTTLVLYLARLARERGLEVAVVGRRYRPGPDGLGDEEHLYRDALGDARCHFGERKLELARAAVAAGARLVLVDDGFSHWALERDLDIVLLDATDPLGGGRLLPAGRLREPLRALQRAAVVVLSRVPPGEDPAARLSALSAWAPAARFAAARHVISGVRSQGGGPAPASGPARVVSATGNPAAVADTAREAGFAPVTLSAYRDHHWFTPAERRREGEAARATGAAIVLSAKDAVRWPAERGPADVRVLEVRWEWLGGGAEVDERSLGGGG